MSQYIVIHKSSVLKTPPVVNECYIDKFGLHCINNDEADFLPPLQLVVIQKIKIRSKDRKCEKCGRVGRDLTRHSLSGHHKPPFIWLCRTPCHDEYHNILSKEYVKKQQKIAKMTDLKNKIQFTGVDFEVEKINPYISIIKE